MLLRKSLSSYKAVMLEAVFDAQLCLVQLLLPESTLCPIHLARCRTCFCSGILPNGGLDIQVRIACCLPWTPYVSAECRHFIRLYCSCTHLPLYLCDVG